ncbi:MAG TPA: ferritin family protein [Bacillota bacterium]|nr:ferritin family protein [Bacillota bacterium]HOR84935.1 ferritin family protein [Bacillota bacterium]HPL53949.1 ferritin family protein [Bacillota bacterium]
MTHEEYKRIISYAIKNEEDAYLFYRDVAQKSKDKNISSLFEGFAKDELSHKVLLEGYLSGSVKSLKFATTSDYKVAESIDKPKLSIDMKPSDAIALAMKNEEEAMNMYIEFAGLSNDPDQKETFLDLAEMEKGHKAKLEDLYVSAAFPEAW